MYCNDSVVEYKKKIRPIYNKTPVCTGTAVKMTIEIPTFYLTIRQRGRVV